jgi:hypothetical protein
MVGYDSEDPLSSIGVGHVPACGRLRPSPACVAAGRRRPGDDIQTSGYEPNRPVSTPLAWPCLGWPRSHRRVSLLLPLGNGPLPEAGWFLCTLRSRQPGGRHYRHGRHESVVSRVPRQEVASARLVGGSCHFIHRPIPVAALMRKLVPSHHAAPQRETCYPDLTVRKDGAQEKATATTLPQPGAPTIRSRPGGAIYAT